MLNNNPTEVNNLIALTEGAAKEDQTPHSFSIPHNLHKPDKVTVDSRRNDKHWKEIVEDSCVDPVIAMVAFYSIDNPHEAAAYLHRKGIRTEEDELDKECSWSPLDTGWAVRCVDPYTGKEDKVAGQFKPDRPAPKLDEKGEPKLKDGKPKFDKYLSRNGGGTPMFLAMPDKEYWRKVIDDEQQPLLITEGAKKAAAALSLGYPCVALAGVDNTMDKDEKEQIHRSIEDFLIPGRTVTICYDADWHTNAGVRAGIKKLERRLRKFEGVEVKILRLPNDPEAKGIDDFIRKNSADAFRDAIAKAGERETGEIEEWEFNKNETTIEVAFVEAWNNNYGKDFLLIGGGWISRVGTHWNFIEETEIKKRAIALLEKAYESWMKENREEKKFVFASSANLSNCLSYLHNKVRERIEPDYSGIAFNNGYLDLKTKQFGEVADDKICLYGLDYDYDPTVKECPPQFSQFIESSYGLDQLEFIRAYTSWLLDTTAPWKNFPFLLGKSQSGKSTLLELWKKLLPETAVRSATDVTDTYKEEGRQKIVGKRLLAIGDFTGFIKDPGAILEMVFNHAVTVRKLYSSESPSIKLYCRLIFAAVDIPRLRGKSGWDERVRYIRTKDFVEKLTVPAGLSLEEELAKEISVIASWALNMDKGVRDTYLATKLNKDAHEDAERDNDIVAQFLDEEFTVAEDAEALLDIKKDLYPFFRAFAEYKNQGKDIKEAVFVKRFRDILKKENRVIDGREVIKFRGENVRSPRLVKGLALINLKHFSRLRPGKYEYDPEQSYIP